MSKPWKTVRVFISSTFRDMHAERDHLIKVTFPRLRQWCEERRLRLVDIDLRWGVTKEEADNGKAIEICLHEIDGSRPCFLCILGNRYGYVPDRLPVEDISHFRGLQGQTHKSITHLEIIHAALDSFADSKGETRAVCEHSFFYFRESDCLPQPESIADSADRAEFARTFFETPPATPGDLDCREELERLKEEIRDRFDEQNRVFTYRGEWDAEAANPEDEKLMGRLSKLNTFGDRVEADLIAAIGIEFAEHLAALGAKADPLDEELALHEAFIESRTQVHIPRADIERQ